MPSIWADWNAEEDLGGRGGNVRRPQSQDQWSFDPEDGTGIAFDARGDRADTCSSFSTLSTCEFDVRKLTGLQASLQSQKCSPSWTVPLWLNVSNRPGDLLCRWGHGADNSDAAQFQSGEVDVFERGCQGKSGYVLSLGQPGEHVVKHAWQEGKRPRARTRLTAVLKFNHESDEISSWVCPYSPTTRYIDLPPDALREQGCTHTHSFAGKLAGAQEKYANCMYHLVSDFWGGATCTDDRRPTPADSKCSFKVSHIKLSFSEDPTGSRTWRDVCAALL